MARFQAQAGANPQVRMQYLQQQHQQQTYAMHQSQTTMQQQVCPTALGSLPKNGHTVGRCFLVFH